MKTLTSTGNVLIVGQLHFPHHYSHDKYSTHHGPGAIGGGIGVDVVASGPFVGYYQATLNSGDGFNYPMVYCATEDEIYAWQTGAFSYVAPDGFANAFGEWFNFSGRYSVFDKVPSADWDAWLLAH